MEEIRGGTPGTAILYFGNDWGAENRTSSHHVARALAASYAVYYVEVPGLKAPSASSRDLKKILSKIRAHFLGLRQVGDNLWVATILQLPFLAYPAVRRLNRAIVHQTLRRLIRRRGIVRPIIWFVPPHLGFLAGRLDELISVYYCVDDYASYPGLDRAVIGPLDEETTRKADIVFVTSETLLESKRRLNPQTYLSAHGVDVEHFGAALDEATAVPAELAALRGPVVGYFGLIDDRVDLALIDFLSERRPGWNFVLIGRVASSNEALRVRPNVHLIGARPYESLPAYGKRFDVAIIPYRPIQVNYHANPLKLREYLAMGKAVVALDTPETRRYADVISLATTPQEFLDRIDAAVANPATQEDILRRVDRVRSSGWQERVCDVLDVVHARMSRRGREVGNPPASG